MLEGARADSGFIEPLFPSAVAGLVRPRRLVLRCASLRATPGTADSMRGKTDASGPDRAPRAVSSITRLESIANAVAGLPRARCYFALTAFLMAILDS